MNKLNTPLLKGLLQYNQENILRFHMPGHYGKVLEEIQVLQQNLFALDVTEVPGTDNLSAPEGIIKSSLEYVQEIYHAQHSYYLVNGSTSGIHIAVDSLVPEGGTLLVGRNAHKSVFNIMDQKRIKPHFIYPQMDKDFGVESHFTLEEIQTQVEKALKQKKIHAILLTYPNYYGRAYDIKSIHQYLQSKGIPLILDSAHGAHFTFSNLLPDCGAQHSEICVHSLHKTMPALTQTSLLHVNLPHNQRELVEKNIQFYLSTSPSYILMSSAELSVSVMDKRRKELEQLKNLYDNAVKKLIEENIQVYQNKKPQDFCKLFIRTPLLGEKLSTILREKYKIQCEMTIGNNILFMLGLGHTAQEIDYLVQSILEIVKVHGKGGKIPKPIKAMFKNLETVDQNQREHLRDNITEHIPVTDLRGKVAAENITPYPPGIPLVLKYEIIDKEMAENLQKIYSSSQKFLVFK